MKILSLLEKGSAYHIRDAWRFRGARTSVQQPTVLTLLTAGLAERVETERCVELRITLAGRAAEGLTRVGTRV